MPFLSAGEVSNLSVIAPNFKRRLSGVTSTIIQLIPMQRRIGLTIAALGPGLPDNLPKLRFRDLPRLWRKHSSQAFRIWHARRNTEMVGGIVLRSVLRMPIRLVFTSASQRQHKWFTRWLIRQMDFVVATSAKTASYLKVPNQVIRHGIDIARFSPSADIDAAKYAAGLDPSLRYIGCFGRIRRQKGTDLFLDAVIPVLRDHPGWAAVVAGRATAEHRSFEADLRQRAEATGFGGRILFVGEHTNIDDWYRMLDLFVAPQRWEGFGLTPLEAQACAVPVVATDVGAFTEIIKSGKTGTVLRTLDAGEMETAIRRYVEDDRLRARSAKAARLFMEQDFALEREARELIRVYESVSAGKDCAAEQTDRTP